MLVKVVLFGGESERIIAQHKNSIGRLTFYTHCNGTAGRKTTEKLVQYSTEKSTKHDGPRAILLEIKASSTYHKYTYFSLFD